MPAGGQLEKSAEYVDWMSPGPAAPAPLSNRTRTSGVWAAKSARAAATFVSPVKRIAGSGAWAETPEAKPVNSSRTSRGQRARAAVGTSSAT